MLDFLTHNFPLWISNISIVLTYLSFGASILIIYKTSQISKHYKNIIYDKEILLKINFYFDDFNKLIVTIKKNEDIEHEKKIIFWNLILKINADVIFQLFTRNK